MKKVIFFCFVICLGICVAKQNDRLKKYRARRDVKASGEPRGIIKKRKRGKPIFVIQKHDASRLHYDVRLEIDGVLVSWAVPKGPSLNPADKRLAIRTDDHPMEYADFEGVIPEGEYGAGTVMVWDYGTFENIKTKNGKKISLLRCLKDGTIEIELFGQKLMGKFALIKTGVQSDNKWLLIKMRDAYADRVKNIVRSKTRSALTNRTMKQIARDAL